MKSPGDSELFRKLQPDLAAERELKDRLIEKARKVAANIIGNELQRRVSATEMACSAADSLMSDVKHGRAEPSGTDHLYGMLVHRVRLKTLDAIDAATAQKRDVRQEGGDPGRVGSSASSPAAEIAEREVSEELAKLLCAPEDEIKRCINLLAFLGNYSAPVIRQTLEAQEWRKDKRIPAVRTIQLYLESERERIFGELGLDGDGPAARA